MTEFCQDTKFCKPDGLSNQTISCSHNLDNWFIEKLSLDTGHSSGNSEAFGPERSYLLADPSAVRRRVVSLHEYTNSDRLRAQVPTGLTDIRGCPLTKRSHPKPHPGAHHTGLIQKRKTHRAHKAGVLRVLNTLSRLQTKNTNFGLTKKNSQ